MIGLERELCTNGTLQSQVCFSSVVLVLASVDKLIPGHSSISNAVGSHLQLH